ncbi:hypothetical protein [Mycolicibacterium tusciae]|uniref:hypothetical protein n=1 Tax=Mycolicibacterium tusciae TaxID=75922 RepID=UPI00024A325D|nr:hypothetical protein [Mycolicibacterium tusciae]
MKLDPAYQAYVTALRNVIDLPRIEAAELDEIERRSRSEFDTLDRTRRDAAHRWVGMRDNSARLSRRIDDLAGRVGAPPLGGPVSDRLAPAEVPGALESLRSDLEQADQAWQWVQRHRERRAVAPPQAYVPPSPAPVCSPLRPEPEPKSRSIDPKRLLAIAGVVIVVLLIIVVIAMAF